MDNSLRFSNTSADSVAETLIKNTYKTLLTRGQKGCYIFCEDEALSDYINGLLCE
ncbi:MAG: DUF2075 domain-containing protein [Eubacterium sp.]|nr:DUF2075 domain-containing protein [Eubacterium sp.]